ncbi:hypothetical protein [Naasia aerilata]|uniref:TfoX N-terminal domain-containing protein n=1 Tax=Naasia aerilata TaxID=1162966 RepID=A0ABM8GFU4_9MICO|nr:hypothetical protein [Naasia aerilata]BDZ47223.1 hypothetical protein GCM10025866_31320 [Naasia aerilata]
MKQDATTPEAEAQFDEVLAALGPDVKRSQMMGRPCITTGGKMVACLTQDRLAVKLGRDSDVFASALRLDGAMVFEPGPGRQFKDWVAVPLSEADEWVRLAVAAVEHQRG